MNKVLILGSCLLMLILCLFLQEKAVAGKLGTSWSIRSDGYFITAYHVIDGSKEVFLWDHSRLYKTKVVAIDKDSDLAVLYSTEIKRPSIHLDSRYQYKESSVLLGYPVPASKGYNLKMSTGITRLNGAIIEIEAVICPGNSGGPAINPYGQVRGMVNAGYVLYQFDQDHCTTEGFGTSTKEIRKFLNKSLILLEEGIEDAKSFTQLKKELGSSVILVYSE